MPAWTFIDDGPEMTEEQIEKARPILDMLSARWTELNTQAERNRWAREADDEVGDGPVFEDDAELQAFKARESVKQRLHAAQVGAIEEMMSEHGARIMRPYEHHNEMESYYQWMECGRFGDN